MGIYVIDFIILIIVGLVIWYFNKRNKPKFDKISFKESLDLTDLPVITFYNNGKKFNFMLDTGANYSIVNESILQEMQHTLINKVGDIFGLEGNIQKVRYATIELSYKDNIFTEDAQVLNMDSAFSTVKQESGVTLHGILGNRFFQKYKYILDFNELVAYSKGIRQ